MPTSDLAAMNLASPAWVERGQAVLRILIIYLLPWFVFVPYAPIPGTPLSVDDLLPLILVACGLMVRLWGDRPHFEATAVGLLCFGVFNLLSAFVNADSQVELVRIAARGFGRQALNAGLIITVAFGLRGVRDVERMMKAIVLAAVAQTAFCVWAYTADYTGPGGIGVAPIPTWTDLRRVQGTFSTGVGATHISANFLAAYLMIAALLAVGLSMHKRWLAKLAWSAAALTCVVGIGLSFTRAAFLGLAAGVMVTALCSRRFAPAVVIALVGVVSLVAVPGLGKRLASSDNDRAALYTAAFRIISDHPIAGVGDGKYMDVLGTSVHYQYTPYGKATATSHNSVLLAAAHAGLLAALVLAATLALALVRMALWSWWTDDRRGRAVLATLAGATAALLLQAQVNDLMFVPKTATFFWIFVGMSLAAAKVLRFNLGVGRAPAA